MLVDIADLITRLPFVMDDDEKREANGALADLSFDAQGYGSALWVTPESTPQPVKNLILRAAARHMKNYEGYTVSRAGDETVEWSDKGESAGTATFTEGEQKMLATMGGRGKFIGTVGSYAWGQRGPLREGLVPVSYAPHMRRSDFPLFADGEEPW